MGIDWWDESLLEQNMAMRCRLKASEQIIRLSRMMTEPVGIPDPIEGPGSKAKVIPVRNMYKETVNRNV